MTEYELDGANVRTGRFRKRQFWAKRLPNGTYQRLVPSLLVACEWREKK